MGLTKKKEEEEEEPKLNEEEIKLKIKTHAHIREKPYGRKCWQISAENLIIKANLCHSVIIICTMAMRLSIEYEQRMRINKIPRKFALRQNMCVYLCLRMNAQHNKTHLARRKERKNISFRTKIKLGNKIAATANDFQIFKSIDSNDSFR